MPIGGALAIRQPPEKQVGGVRYRDLHGAMRPMTGIDEAKRPPSRSPALLTRPLRPYAEIFEIPGGLALLHGSRHRADADVDVRARYRPAHLGRYREVRVGLHGVRGRLARLTRSARPWSPGLWTVRPAARPAPPAHGVHRGHRAAHRGRGAQAAHLGFLRAGGDRGIGHAVAGRDGPGALERPARGHAPAARRVLVRVGSRRAVLHHRPGRGDAARDRGLLASGVGVAAVLCLVGTLWFAAERGTEPVVVRPERAVTRAGRQAARVRRHAPAPG